MHQLVYFFKEEDFNESENLQLLIQVSDEFYGFTAFNAIEKKVKAWALYQAKNNVSLSETDLIEIKNEQLWLSYTYVKATIIACGASSALLPEALYREENNLFNLMYGQKSTDIFLKDRINAADAVNEYSVPYVLYQSFQTNFSNTVWHHIQSLLLQQTASADARITVAISFHSIFITAEQNNKWMLLQNKTYQSPEDVLYHMLNTIKQLGFDGEKTSVILEGMAEADSALANLLYQYVNNMEWNTNLQFSYPVEASSISKHTLALTDRLLTCVL